MQTLGALKNNGCTAYYSECIGYQLTTTIHKWMKNSNGHIGIAEKEQETSSDTDMHNIVHCAITILHEQRMCLEMQRHSHITGTIWSLYPSPPSPSIASNQVDSWIEVTHVHVHAIVKGRIWGLNCYLWCGSVSAFQDTQNCQARVIMRNFTEIQQAVRTCGFPPIDARAPDSGPDSEVHVCYAACTGNESIVWMHIHLLL